MHDYWKNHSFDYTDLFQQSDVSDFYILFLKLCEFMQAMTNLDNILKSKEMSLPTKAHIIKALIFPVVMYGCESWTIKKAEH